MKNSLEDKEIDRDRDVPMYAYTHTGQKLKRSIPSARVVKKKKKKSQEVLPTAPYICAAGEARSLKYQGRGRQRLMKTSQGII